MKTFEKENKLRTKMVSSNWIIRTMGQEKGEKVGVQGRDELSMGHV